MVIAGAGSGKTEVMARRVAWWVAHDGIKKRSVIAFTFTERAAEEMRFRIRRQISHITPEGEDPTLGDMYVGTIHAFCMRMLRELAPDPYHSYSIVDDVARLALLGRRFWDILPDFKKVTGKRQYAAQDLFLAGYDLLNEYNLLDVELPDDQPPIDPAEEKAWFSRARLRTRGLGRSKGAKTFGEAAAKFYAYLRCRRFLDFSTSQSELVKLLQSDANARSLLRERYTHVVVDEVQDLNPVQHDLLDLIVGKTGTLTAVGDHRQAIFGWRGGRVDLMAELGKSISESRNGVVVELEENFRSTPRIVDVANRWARTIHTQTGLTSPDMVAGNTRRQDADDSHVRFSTVRRTSSPSCRPRVASFKPRVSNCPRTRSGDCSRQPSSSGRRSRATGPRPRRSAVSRARGYAIGSRAGLRRGGSSLRRCTTCSWTRSVSRRGTIRPDEVRPRCSISASSVL